MITHSFYQKKTVQKILLLFFSLQISILVFADDWVYTVRKGDTLWDLCLEYTNERACWLKLGPYNNVDFPPSLAPGTRIRFPAEWLKNQPVSVEIIYLNGEVWLTNKVVDAVNEEQAQMASVGMRLEIGTNIQTASSSTVSLRFADGSVLVLEENSEIILDVLSQHGANGMVDSRLRLLRGTSSAKVKKRKPASRFSITSPSAVAAVRGTDFRVRAEPDEAGSESVTLASVYEGAIEVSGISAAGGEKNINKKDLSEGFGIKAVAGKPLSSPVKLLPAPGFTLSEESYSLPLELEWQKVSGAEAYELQFFLPGQEDKLVKTISTVKSQFIDRELADGCYRIRLRAIDVNGFLGLASNNRFCAESPALAPVIQSAILDENNNLAVAWTHEGDSSKYLIEIASDRRFSNLLYSEMVTEKTKLLPLNSDKAIYLRVKAIGQYGIEGASSEHQKLKAQPREWLVLVFIFLPVLLTL